MQGKYVVRYVDFISFCLAIMFFSLTICKNVAASIVVLKQRFVFEADRRDSLYSK